MEIVTKASADVGNSSTKIIVVEGLLKKARKQPSVISYLPTVPKFNDDDLDVLVANLHKNMVVHVTSESIARNGLFAVGDAANSTGGMGFNINGHRKADQDLSIIQPLAMIGVTAVQNAYTHTGKLPNSIAATVEYATAIPVVDYTKADAKILEEKLIGNHTLIVYVGEGHRVTVTVDVVGAKAVQEGVPVFYALINGQGALFDDYNERYGVNFTGKDFTHRKLLLVDIGDGTIEIIYIVNGKPVISKSTGEHFGVGYASEKAMQTFVTQYNFKSKLNRTKFMEKVLNKTDKWHNEASHILKLSTFEQENLIYDKIVDTIEHVLLHDVDDVVVFGGGTNVFKDLQDRLIDYTKRYKMRTLWVDGKDSSLLTAIGLDDLNHKVFFKQ